MANLEGDAPPLQFGQKIQEAGELLHGIVLIAVGVGKVGVDPLRLQAGQGAHRLDVVRRTLQRRPAAQLSLIHI